MSIKIHTENKGTYSVVQCSGTYNWDEMMKAYEKRIIDKIAEGKLNKFYKDNTLLNQAFVKDNAMNVAKYLDSVSKGLTVETFKRVSVN